MRTVTALRVKGQCVAVELDGVPWRTLPIQVVVEAGLSAGLTLDRERARALARALRRQRAADVATRALSYRDRSRSELDARLAQAGVRDDDRRETLERAARAGLVDDVRFAEARGRMLADRNAGDQLVLDELARHGIEPDVARGAVSRLEPEAVRAARIVATRGRTARTLRYLASRGFAPESVEDLIAELERGATMSDAPLG